MSLAKFAKLYRVDDPDNFRIKDWDPGDTNNLDIEKDEAKDLLVFSPGAQDLRIRELDRVIRSAKQPDRKR